MIPNPDQVHELRSAVRVAERAAQRVHHLAKNLRPAIEAWELIHLLAAEVARRKREDDMVDVDELQLYVDEAIARLKAGGVKTHHHGAERQVLDDIVYEEAFQDVLFTDKEKVRFAQVDPESGAVLETEEGETIYVERHRILRVQSFRPEKTVERENDAGKKEKHTVPASVSFRDIETNEIVKATSDDFANFIPLVRVDEKQLVEA